ncbi:LysR family transcriptional regulator [Amycolatopsis sp. NPDC049253]|uniref:LysR family transcriptional regulator n=1 Tax=Amycolatopsis sp. NPDC049253 TaxID=3155274 RepID=UPI0034361712
MDLHVLRLFREVARGATVTDTAARARLTQPALSRALHRIEREAGAALFQRSGRALRLTPAGHAFATHVDAILERYDEGLRAVAEAVDPESGVIPLAFLHTFGTWLVPPVVSSYRAEHPRARFELRQHGEEGLARELLDGTADLVLTSGDPGDPLIQWVRLLEEPLLLAVPPKHRLARRKQARLADVAEETFILLRRGYALRETTEQLCARAGFTPRVGFEGEEVETLRGLVTAGLGVSLLPLPHTATFPPAATAPTTPHLRVTDVPAARDIGLAQLAGRVLPPASETFRQHVLATAPRALPA